MLFADNAARLDISTMTQIISQEFPPKLKSLDVNVKQRLPSSTIENMNIEHKLHTPRPDENSLDATTTLRDPNSPSSDSDTDDDDHTADLPDSLLTNAQRKQAQNAVFKEFVREKDDSQLQERLRETEGSMEMVDDASPLGTVSARRIIDRVRDYQSELFARAKAGNIIAVLDTGTGKTLVAALLIRETVCREMDDRASGRSPRTCFFLVRQHVWRLQMLRTDFESHCRQPALLLQNSSIKCSVRIWLQSQLWCMAEHWILGGNKSGTTCSAPIASLFAQQPYCIIVSIRLSSRWQTSISSSSMKRIMQRKNTHMPRKFSSRSFDTV
jgi:hypothetical protein